jgi:hypothetical protein
MTRVYLDSKKVDMNPDLYARYGVLNLYVEERRFYRGLENKNFLYGLFLSDIPADVEKNHGNEVHFPILFTSEEKAKSLFRKLKSHADIKKFQDGLDALFID